MEEKPGQSHVIYVSAPDHKRTAVQLFNQAWNVFFGAEQVLLVAVVKMIG